MPDTNAAHPTNSSPLLVVLAWAIVILPTAWGLNYTIQSALKIFTAPAPAAASPAPAEQAPAPATSKP